MPPRKKVYRVAEPGQNIVTDPDSGLLVVPDPTRPYPGDHPLVKRHPHLFVSDEDVVEAASAIPGEKRSVGIPKSED